MTLAIVVFHYLLRCVPEEFLNGVDQGVLNFFGKKFRTTSWPWEPALAKAVLIFSDQQLVTGLAILVSGFTQLRRGISVYHWQIIVYLAWFSSLTHLTTLTTLRQHFRDRSLLRTWRAWLMLLLVAMLTVAFIPTGDAEWQVRRGAGSASYLNSVPVICYYRRLAPRRSGDTSFKANWFDQTSSMLISITVLFFGYMTRMVKVSRRATRFTRAWMRTRPGNLLRATLQRSQKRNNKVCHGLVEIIYVNLQATFELFDSMMWEVGQD